MSDWGVCRCQDGRTAKFEIDPPRPDPALTSFQSFTNSMLIT